MPSAVSLLCALAGVTGIAGMLAVHRQRFTACSTALLLSSLAAASAHAQTIDIFATCGSPALFPSPSTPAPAEPPAAGAAPEPIATLACNVRATNGVAIKGVRVTAKGRTEALDSLFIPFDART